MDGAVDSVVLRTVPFGEADVVVRLLTLQRGRCSAVAKGARSRRSRLGASIEPYLVARCELRSGRGELPWVSEVARIDALPALRSSWHAQGAAADAVRDVERLTVEHERAEPVFHLLHHLLRALDAASSEPVEGVEGAARTLVAAFELKLLHAVGLEPQLDACVRCGGTDVSAFSAADGGVVCRACRTTTDRSVGTDDLDLARALTRHRLESVQGDVAPSAAQVERVRRAVFRPVVDAHG